LGEPNWHRASFHICPENLSAAALDDHQGIGCAHGRKWRGAA